MRIYFGVSSRSEDSYLKISETIFHLDRRKLCAHCDLDACFLPPDEKVSHLGRVFSNAREEMRQAIIDRNHRGKMPARRIDLAQAAPQTNMLMQCLYPHTQEAENARLSDQEWVWAATGVFLPLKDMSESIRPKNLNLFYLGDFLDCLNTVISLDDGIRSSIKAGDAEKTLQIFQRLQKIPDYRYCFPDPPSSGSAGGKRARGPIFAPAGGTPSFGY